MNYCLFASKQGLLFESHALFEGVNIIGMGVNIVRIRTINHICTEVHNWMYNPNYKPKPIKRRLTKQITSVPLRHLVWNITARFMNPKLYSGDNKANFIKALFPKEFADTEIDTIKNFKVDARKSEIPIDEPEGDNFSFHYPEDYTPKQLL